jgi:hypothetical protein
MHLPVALAAVSDAAAAVLGSQFGRAPVLLSNGMDGARFAPGPRSARPPDAVIEPDPGLAPVAPGRLPLPSWRPQPPRRVCALLSPRSCPEHVVPVLWTVFATVGLW